MLCKLNMNARGVVVFGRLPAWLAIGVLALAGRVSAAPAECPAARQGGARTASSERGVEAPSTARFALPTRASGEALLEDVASGLSVRIRLEGARDVPFEWHAGERTFANGFGAGSTVRARPLPNGFEDFVSLPRAPEHAALDYLLTLNARVAGLRLVENQLELLSADGAPRLRVPAPSLVDAGGRRHLARLALLGCAFDSDPRPPWNRAVTAPGAGQCTVRVRWTASSYPMLVDPAWQSTGSLAYKRSHHTATTLKSGLVLITGGEADEIVPGELYDPKTRTFSVTGACKEEHYGQSASLLQNGRVLIVGGDRPLQSASATSELFDPATGKCTPTGSLNDGRSWASAVTLNDGRVLLAGGMVHGIAPGAISDAVELYDPTLGTWSKGASLAAGRVRNSMTKLGDGRVLVVGGFAANSVLTAPELYDPTQNKWQGTGSLVFDETLSSSVLMKDGRILVAGCGDAGELYDPATNTWQKTGDQTYKRCGGQTLTLLADGDALLSGGEGDLSAERFQASTGKWIPVGQMSTHRYNATATALANGSVLLTGGGTMSLNGDDFAPTESAETFTLFEAGATCELDGDCKSAVCVDGVCCATQCDAMCNSCAAASKVSGPDGVCGLAKLGTDPHESCSDTKSESCGTNGSCDGAGACQRYPAGTACAVEGCTSTKHTTPGTCNSTGQCVGSVVTECAAGYQCVSGACATSCSNDAACANGFRCAAGSCSASPGGGDAGSGGASGSNGVATHGGNANAVGGAGSMPAPGETAGNSSTGSSTPTSSKHGGCTVHRGAPPRRLPLALTALLAVSHGMRRRRARSRKTA